MSGVRIPRNQNTQHDSKLDLAFKFQSPSLYQDLAFDTHLRISHLRCKTFMRTASARNQVSASSAAPCLGRSQARYLERIVPRGICSCDWSEHSILRLTMSRIAAPGPYSWHHDVFTLPYLRLDMATRGRSACRSWTSEESASEGLCMVKLLEEAYWVKKISI